MSKRDWDKEARDVTAEEYDAHRDAEELSEYLNEKAAQFDKLCVDRHEAGQQEYGSITFLGNDVVRMMLEELADTANYCRMQGIKLLMLQEQLEEELAERAEGDDIKLGFQSFKGIKDIGWGNN